MNLRYIAFAVCMLVAFASCTKKADVWKRADVNEAKMLSFGFYKADNPDVLVKDYVITQVNSSNILVLMPPNIDRNGLVARFTAGDNDIIRVGNTVQKSGETVNDFRVPVDYILTDGNNNAKYTVTIARGGDYIWKPVPFTIVDSSTTISMKVNPVNGSPYIMYAQSRTSTADSKAAMAVYENNQWVDLGAISDGRAGNFDFTFSSTGVPYASYADYTTPTAQFNTVKKLDALSWTLVGNKGFTPVRVTYNAIAFDNESRLQVFSAMDAVGGGFARRELGVSTFENNVWTTAKVPGRLSTLSTYLNVAKLKNGALYVGIYNAITPNSFSIYKFANNTWTTLLDQWRDPAATTGNIYDFDIDVDDNGNVYAAFVDNSDAAVSKHRVIKYNEASQTVTSVGRYLTGATGSSVNFDLALSPNGVPYLFYRASGNYPTIVSFDEDSQDWTIPASFESEAADQLMLDFAPNGEAYLAYLKNRKFFVQKYSAP
ncbi:MAG: hypothetical protein ACTHMC_03515 [Pseudobacter sp.]|uniref:hypothetical protein n=1 Tax=Pseudobacter sp. TaxID=2045420 RepID=UPI003F821EC0